MGYWKYDQEQNVSFPHGFWAKYGQEKVIYQEGVYLGAKNSWNRLVKAQKLGKDFRKNQKPQFSLGQVIGNMFGGCGVCCSSAQDQKEQTNMALQPIVRPKTK